LQVRRCQAASQSRLGGDIAGTVLGQEVDPRLADRAGWKANGSSPYGEVFAEHAQGSAHRVELTLDRRRGAVAGDGDVAPPFAVEPTPAHEGLPRHFDADVESNGQRGLRRRLQLPRAQDSRFRFLWIAAVDLDDV